LLAGLVGSRFSRITVYQSNSTCSASHNGYRRSLSGFAPLPYAQLTWYANAGGRTRQSTGKQTNRQSMIGRLVTILCSFRLPTSRAEHPQLKIFQRGQHGRHQHSCSLYLWLGGST
jgi:hypothetical protein